MSPVPALLDQFRANPRARLGIWLIAGILWLNADLDLRDRVAGARARYQSVSQELDFVRANAHKQEWPERAESAKLALAQLEGLLWQAATPGLAEARFRDWLVAELNKAGAQGLRVDVVSARDAFAHAAVPDDVWVVRAHARFGYTPATLEKVLTLIATAKNLVAVDSLTLRERPSREAELKLNAYFQANH